MAQPPLLIQEGNSESRFVCMTARTTKCKNWRRQCGHHCSQPPKKWPISRRRSMTAGVSLIPGKAGAHRAPLQLGSEFCRLDDEALRCRTNVVEGIARHEGDGILRLGLQDVR